MSWRKNLGYGLGLLVLVPAVIAAKVLPWQEKYQTLTGKGGREAVAAHGQPARLNGMEWRLKSITEGKPPQEFARPLPPRTKIAIVLTSVKPLTEQASKWFGATTGSTCKFTLTDAAGRTWAPSFRTDLAPKSGYAASCFALDADYKPAPLPVGKELTTQTVFVVPADAFTSLRVEVRLTPDPGTVRLAR
ncbi:hypothetical protein [Sphaerisporangium perillae]|uniref:hypothetical protein n=1 Tax=Sphaerisporangium perillae TaxID=2935860 RepID=UPI00200E66C9|nr:hypothetical protein [Sphaerisporangium perillae]